MAASSKSARPAALSAVVHSAPLLLFATGSLLAVTVILSGRAAGEGAQMLWFLVAVFAGAAGLIVPFAVARGLMRGAGAYVRYAAGAGILAAVPSALGYLSVGHVGASYVSLVFALPMLVTYLLALPLGMDRPSPLKFLAVGLGLAGGALLALGKAADGGSEPVWIALASAIPLMLAVGNLYRTRFWPRGADPAPLAVLTLVAGAAVTLPVAFLAEGAPRAEAGFAGLAVAGAAVFALQYVLLFRLQRLAGPVYLSQIGSVAAAMGAALAAFLLGERLPAGFVAAALLIGLGLVAYHLARTAQAQSA